MIENSLVVSVLWAFGSFAAVWLLMGNEWSKTEKWTVGFCVLFSVVAFLPTQDEEIYQLHLHIFMAFVFFVFIFSIFFRERILPFVSEHILLIWNLLMLNVTLPLIGDLPVPFALILIPSIITFVFACIPYEANGFWKFFLYVWFLCMVATVGIVQSKLSVLSVFFDEQHPLRMTVADAFFSGMAFVLIGSNLVYLFLLIPIPARNQSWRSRLQDWKEHKTMMIGRFHDHQLRFPTTLIIIGTVGGMMVANAYWHVVSDLLLINLTIILAPRFLHVLEYLLPSSHPAAKKDHGR